MLLCKNIILSAATLLYVFALSGVSANAAEVDFPSRVATPAHINVDGKRKQSLRIERRRENKPCWSKSKIQSKNEIHAKYVNDSAFKGSNYNSTRKKSHYHHVNSHAHRQPQPHRNCKHLKAKLSSASSTKSSSHSSAPTSSPVALPKGSTRDNTTNTTTTSSTSASGSGPYTRVQENRGSGFWSGNNWDFWDQPDPTHGQVLYRSEADAKSQGLVGLKNGAAFMRASNQDISGTNRPSVRFQSKQAFDSGLVIFDVRKLPIGCSTWPALWSTGPDWPRNGEIDVVEGVGYTAGGKNVNQMTVHLAQNSPLQLTKRGSEMDKRATSFLGKVMKNGSNCDQWSSGNPGCAFFDSNQHGPSWGEPFNAAGGGVWAMQFGHGEGVKIWFWGRQSGKIPSELSQANISPKHLDPGTWGTPMSNFQNSAINDMIKGQNIIMDITIGGDWAGNVPMDGACAGQNLQTAIKKGSNYDDAEFIINAIDIYCRDGTC
ncbi:hypothetical protein CBS101457_001844 [Exobasidium rhododendri]|nr:hypothetical protein CBS101457_001844 [Exobasidium rhododendri]